MRNNWRLSCYAMLLFIVAVLLPVVSRGATMYDYCIVPPFIQQGVIPNLLMMLDNSASMYDLTFVDRGTATRTPYYCYDKTYNSANKYEGYFSRDTDYEYDFTNDYFYISAIPLTCDRYVANTLCLNGSNLGTTSTPKTVTKFVAKGNYLNWLTSSKFDIQKKVLTGGKYVDKVCSGDNTRSCTVDSECNSGQTCNDVTNFLQNESRGCVGRGFVKEALTANYVEGGTNTPLQITFRVRGPVDPNNKTAPSPGGQSYIEIFGGDYDEAKCQTAINSVVALNLGQAKTDVKACLEYPSGASQDAVQGVIFNQTMQACMALAKGTPLSVDDVNTVVKQCQDIYAFTDPGNISPTNPAYLCSTSYVGACYDKTQQATDSCLADDGETGLIKTNGGKWDKDILKGAAVLCGRDCIIEKHQQFCGTLKVPPVVDPSDSPSITGLYSNVPAILIDTGVVAQLDLPLKTLTVKIRKDTPPSGLLQDPNFTDKIRYGAMSFNFAGTPSECSDAAGSSFYCPRICSNDTSKSCTSDFDCPGQTAGLCIPTSKNVDNLDGGKLIHYIGSDGKCSVTTSTSCVNDSGCPTNEQCRYSVGSHSTGLIRAIDNIRGVSWTPYAEAFYSAIAYYAQNTTSSTTRPYRLNSNDFTTALNPVQYSCQQNNILMISDGMSTTDQNATVMNFINTYNTSPLSTGGGQITTTASTDYLTSPQFYGSKNLDDMAWFAQNKNIFDPSQQITKSKEKIRTYVVYSGDECSAKDAAGKCTTTDEAVPEKLMQLTASKGGGKYNLAKDYDKLLESLQNALAEISAGSASGTAASILSNSEGSGANILQAVFYPSKDFEKDASNKVTSATWIGEMHNLWYHVDPQINNSTIREDTIRDQKFNLKEDHVTNFFFDTTTNQTQVQLQQDLSGDGTTLVNVGAPKSPDLVKSLWRAGRRLWERDATTRDIKTNIDGTLTSFSTANAATLESYLQAAPSASHTEATNIINYVNGIDYPRAGLEATDPTYRKRTVDIKDPDTGVTSTSVWKLGDIISSTPRLQSSVRQNTYDIDAPGGYSDKSYASFVGSNEYKKRGMVYVGANDGMLHAFKLGKLDVTASGYEQATLTNPDPATPLGYEKWAFIPKNVLPYLKYMTDPTYAHLYSVDGSTSIVDVSIGVIGGCTQATYDTCLKQDSVVDTNNNIDPTKNTWRSVLVGGMGLGGSSRNWNDTCVDGAGGTCVKTPSAGVNGVGYSSYFAFDVTKHDAPSLMWEFSNPELGYATTGPAIVRIGADRNKNGKWFAVFASGSTGPIDTTTHQFLGRSNQNLKFFVVELNATPPFVLGTNYWVIDSGITNAFAGSMIGGAIDTDRWNKPVSGNYQDDAIYVGYVKQAADGTWTDGGVLRILTKENSNPGTQWKPSTVIDGIGPVTTQIARLQDKKNHNLWLYFGTGRYYYRQRSILDDKDGRRALYGVKDTCYTNSDALNQSCDTAGAAIHVTPLSNPLTNQTTSISSSVPRGWYINLDASTTSVGAERVVTDTVALTNGAVFFTSYMPTTDPCGFGGDSYLWGVKYDTGGRADCAALVGKALIQLSTGEFKEVDLSSVFGCPSPVPPQPPPIGSPTPPPPPERLGRRMGTPMTGKPPGDAPPIVSKSGNKPVKRILHIQER